MSDTPRTDAVSRITEYLGVGGLFNPEILNLQQHEAVRDTLIQARDELTAAQAENAKLQERVKRLVTLGNTMANHYETVATDSDDDKRIDDWRKAAEECK